MAISKVVVVDGNNLTVRIDRGVAGRGVTDVQPVEIDNALYLEFFFSDGTTETVGPVGTIQYIGQAPIVVNASTISLSTVPVNLGGTGQVTANAGFNALAPSQTSNAGKYLKTDGTNAAWDLLDISTADITGVLPIANGGTNATTAAGARTNLNAANQDTTISAGTGLSGGGSLAANRTISIANTAVTAASYGAASKTLTATVNAQGQLTALADTPIAIANTQISGLGTMSTQNANAVAITGGSITGITDLAVVDGGTGASTAAGARTNLGLGTAAVLNAGVANGVATLDAGGTVPLSQIPASIQGGVSYQGSWNAATNTPTIVSSVGTKGHYYVVSVAGSTNINGITDWLPGDWIIFNGSVWEQIDNTDTVQSVNGYVGAVVLTAADVGAPPTTRTITAGTGLSGGGDLSANRTIDIANTAVSAGSYGTASSVPSITVNAQGQLTAASNTTIAIANTQVSGLGTMSTQNANAVAITGGTATLTSLTVNDNTTLGSSNTDEVTFTARVASEFSPTTANTYDLGRNSHEWRNLYLTGTANISALTASGAVTLSGGTANGVAYLNGSKVLTTGSALVFDGSKLTVTSSGEQIKLTSSGDFSSTGTGFLRFYDSVGAKGYVGYGGTASRFDINAGTSMDLNMNAVGGTMTFQTSNSEKMRLTSTGLGIGTSSPSTRLDVNGSTYNPLVIRRDGGTDANTGVVFQLATNYWNVGAGTDGNFGIVYNSANLQTSTQFRITSAGNVGIGTSSPEQKLEVVGPSGGEYFRAGGGSVAPRRLTFSSFDAGASDVGHRITAQGGTTTPGVIAFATGNNTTVAERLRIDGIGNVGIGTTSPAYKLVVSAAGASGLEFGPAYSGTSNLIQSYNRSGGAYVNTAYDAANHVYIISGTEGMRLTSTGLGIGTSSPESKLVAVQALQGNDVSTGAALLMTTSTAASDRLNLNFSMSGVQNRARAGIGAVALDSSGGYNCGLAFYTRSASDGSALATTDEKMRIDSSGNVGIGTSSPAYKLDVRGTGNQTIAVRTQTSGDAKLYLENAGSNAGSITYSRSLQSLLFSGQDATTHMTLNSSGNLGLGVTPSAWNSSYKVMQIGSGAVLSQPAAPAVMDIYANAYIDSAFANRYIGTAAASHYEQNGGQHRWYNAASGTAGAVISWTQAMTLNASGQLAIGTTSPSSGAVLTLQESATNTTGLIIKNRNSTQSWNISVDAAAVDDRILAFIDPAAGAVRMALNASGNLGLGVTPSAWWSSRKVLQLGNAGGSGGYGHVLTGTNVSYVELGANYYTNSTPEDKYIATGFATRYYQFNGSHIWQNVASGTAGATFTFTQAMTLDASGNLLVGVTSQFGGADCKIQAKNGSVAQSVAFLWNATTSGDANFVAFGTEASVTQRGSITYNRAGGLTAYNTTSDYRAKDIIGPVTDSGALIDSTPVYMGKMKGATQERPMFIAHETPVYAHTGEKDAVDADGNPVYQQMDASALVPVMWAEIQSLRQRLAAAGI